MTITAISSLTLAELPRVAFGHKAQSPKTVHGITPVDTDALQDYFLKSMAGVTHKSHNAQQAQQARLEVAKVATAVAPLLVISPQSIGTLLPNKEKGLKAIISEFLKVESDEALSQQLTATLKNTAVQADQAMMLAAVSGQLPATINLPEQREKVLQTINTIGQKADQMVPYVRKALEATRQLLAQF